MANICQITGKHSMTGNNVSHSNRKTKRRFMVNLCKKKFYLPEEDRWVALTISTAGMRVISKNGLAKALKSAHEKGYLNAY